jgi:uncharacterized membrane protein YhiD involved in acid resistance
MGQDELVIMGRVLLALLLGGLIGMERTFTAARPAFAPMRWSVSPPRS